MQYTDNAQKDPCQQPYELALLLIMIWIRKDTTLPLRPMSQKLWPEKGSYLYPSWDIRYLVCRRWCS